MSGSDLFIPRNKTAWPRYFQNKIIMFCLPISLVMYLWVISIFPGSVCLFCCSQIGRPILRIYKSLTYTWIQELGMMLCSFISGLHKSDLGTSVYRIYIELIELIFNKTFHQKLKKAFTIFCCRCSFNGPTTNIPCSTPLYITCWEFFKQSMGIRNRVGIELLYQPARLCSSLSP